MTFLVAYLTSVLAAAAYLCFRLLAPERPGRPVDAAQLALRAPVPTALRRPKLRRAKG